MCIYVGLHSLAHKISQSLNRSITQSIIIEMILIDCGNSFISYRWEFGLLMTGISGCYRISFSNYFHVSSELWCWKSIWLCASEFMSWESDSEFIFFRNYPFSHDDDPSKEKLAIKNGLSSLTVRGKNKHLFQFFVNFP